MDEVDELNHGKMVVHRLHRHFLLFGLLSLAWYVLRTGTKPSRASYPCQQAAATNGSIWLSLYMLPLFSLIRRSSIFASMPKKSTILRDGKLIAVLAMLTVATMASAYFVLWKPSSPDGDGETTTRGFTLVGRLAEAQPSSDIFAVTGTSGNDSGVVTLINLMGSKGLLFYKSSVAGLNKGPNGLIAVNEVVLIKVNCQWDERGGTNTDLLKALIKAIASHPDGFSGEIIVADNGQAQGGSSGHGGSLNWGRSNAADPSQSAQKVVDSFAYSSSFRVSTYLWDTITEKRVNEYSDGDMEDGYIVNSTVNQKTRLIVSYPKFKTKFGTYVSFKRGIWDPHKQSYDGDRLKVINLPVLKSHSVYGVTASVKHYQGVVSDKLTAGLGYRSHDAIAYGGMGTEMVETRFPVLNILDAIWVNAVPRAGPSTSYSNAMSIKVIAASTDPIALDYWAAKNILLKAWQMRTNSTSPSFDPDNTVSGFGKWLMLSMQEISGAEYWTTTEETHMNVYVTPLKQ